MEIQIPDIPLENLHLLKTEIFPVLPAIAFNGRNPRVFLFLTSSFRWIHTYSQMPVFRDRVQIVTELTGEFLYICDLFIGTGRQL